MLEATLINDYINELIQIRLKPTIMNSEQLLTYKIKKCSRNIASNLIEYMSSVVNPTILLEENIQKLEAELKSFDHSKGEPKSDYYKAIKQCLHLLHQNLVAYRHKEYGPKLNITLSVQEIAILLRLLINQQTFDDIDSDRKIAQSFSVIMQSTTAKKPIDFDHLYRKLKKGYDGYPIPSLIKIRSLLLSMLDDDVLTKYEDQMKACQQQV